MNKITSVHLNGKAYQFEEAAYDDLRAYLDESAAKLDGNPDKDEIISDLEQAIADKCAKYLHADKDVLTASEMDEILKVMGRVETEPQAGADASSANDGTSKPPKKLYRNPDDEMVAGVCSGLANYFNIDVTLVRLLFVAAAFITNGAAVIVYIIMAIVLPKGKKNAQTAQEIIDNSKRKVQDFSEAGKSTGLTKKILWAIIIIASAVLLLNLLAAIFGMNFSGDGFEWYWHS